MKKHIHIHLHDGEWDESKHPRKDNGQFGSGGGGELRTEQRHKAGKSDPVHGGKSETSSAERKKRIEQLRVAVKEDPSDERLANELRKLENDEKEPVKLSKGEANALEDAVDSESKRMRDEFPREAKLLTGAYEKLKKGEQLEPKEASKLADALADRAQERDSDKEHDAYVALSKRIRALATQENNDAERV